MRRITFLDDDHVVRLARTLLQAPSDAQAADLRAFFAPEPVDLATLRAMGAGLLPADGVEVAHPAAPLVAPATDACAIVLRRGQVDAAVLDAAGPHLCLVQRLGAGSESIALAEAARRGVQVSCLPRPSLSATAEHALALMLALSKRLLAADAAVRAGVVDRTGADTGSAVAYNWAGLTGLGGLDGRTLGIVGMGEVGRLVAARAQAFGMRVLYNNRSALPTAREAALGVSWRPLGRLMAESDIVSLHVPGTQDNRRLLGAAAFAQMQPHAFFVNTSRGYLVDEDALYDALRSGRIAGAALDVHAQEPRVADDRFCRLPNVVLTPHIGGGSRLSVLKELAAVFDNLRAAFAGRPVPHARIRAAALMETA